MDFSFSLSRSIRLTFVAATAWILVFLISITGNRGKRLPRCYFSCTGPRANPADLVSADGQPLSQTDLTQLAQDSRAGLQHRFKF